MESREDWKAIYGVMVKLVNILYLKKMVFAIQFIYIYTAVHRVLLYGVHRGLEGHLLSDDPTNEYVLF